MNLTRRQRAVKEAAERAWLVAQGYRVQRYTEAQANAATALRRMGRQR